MAGYLGNSQNAWVSWKFPVIWEIYKILKIYQTQISVGIWEISQIPRHLGNSYFWHLFIGFNCTPISEYHPKLKVLKTKDSSTGFFKKLVKDLLLFGIVLYYKKKLAKLWSNINIPLNNIPIFNEILRSFWIIFNSS